MNSRSSSLSVNFMNVETNFTMPKVCVHNLINIEYRYSTFMTNLKEKLILNAGVFPDQW